MGKTMGTTDERRTIEAHRKAHRHPLHRFRKRTTLRHHIIAKRRERHVSARLQAGSAAATQPPGDATVVTPPTTAPSLNTIGIPEPIVGVQPLKREHTLAEDLHDWVLGGQDGLVNVLGSILGVAIVTQDRTIIIVAGLAALFAESISMAAVAYTSVRASQAYYHSQRDRMLRAIRENPVLQRELLIDAYEHKGLTRTDASRIVSDLIRDEEVWLETLMQEHLRLYAPEESAPLRSSAIVGFASLAGSLVPLLPFFFLTGIRAISTTVVLSAIVLFGLGAAGAKLTIGDWKARGVEMAGIGMTAAVISFCIGFIAKMIVG
jgi:VIT1/CCC1 family predicted Fe2+/Mn2+ transporter